MQWFVEHEATKAESKSLPEPNVVCLGEGDLFVELDEDGIFRDAGYGEGNLRAIAPKFVNEPKLPKREKVGSAQKVRAQIIFYEPDWPDREYLRVDHACWLDERSPYVTLGLDGVGYVIAGIFETPRHASGYKTFTIYGNHPVKNGAQPLLTMPPHAKYKIKVRLIVGEHGEFSSEHDFELDAQGGVYSFEHVTETEKELRNESTKAELKKLVNEGDKLFNTPFINMDWDKLYSDVHTWNARVCKMVRRFYGLVASSRVDSSTITNQYPHKITDGYKRFFDEYYSRFIGLQEIAREQGVSFTTTSPEEVAKERSKRIVADLSAFSEQGNGLLQSVLHGYGPSMRMGVMKWEDRVYTYLENHLDKSVAISFISDTDLETCVLPESTRTFQRDLLDRVHTRIVRLSRLVEKH